MPSKGSATSARAPDTDRQTARHGPRCSCPATNVEDGGITQTNAQAKEKEKEKERMIREKEKEISAKEVKDGTEAKDGVERMEAKDGEEKTEAKDGMEDTEENRETSKERVKVREERVKAKEECMNLRLGMSGIIGDQSGRGMIGKEEIGTGHIHLLLAIHGCADYVL